MKYTFPYIFWSDTNFIGSVLNDGRKKAAAQINQTLVETFLTNKSLEKDENERKRFVLKNSSS